MNEIKLNNNETNELFIGIKNLVEQSRNRVYKTINNEMVDLHWNIGKMIVEKQDGNDRAKYGDLLIEEISKRLTKQFGKGFSIQNLRRMRQLYLCFPIRSTMLSELGNTYKTASFFLSSE